MRISYPLLALVVGLVGFAAIELGGALLGITTAITRSLWLDAAAYGSGTLLLALAFAPLFRRTRGWLVLGVVVLFLLLYAPLVAAIAGVLELTLTGGWAFPGLVRSAFIASPVNLILTFVLELWFVAVPLGIVSVLVLWRHARRAAGPAAARPRSTVRRPPSRGGRAG